MKRYQNKLFGFVLPEEWPQDPDPELSIFRSPDGRFNLTISVRPVSSTFPPEAVAAAFAEFVRERRKAEADVGEVILTPEEIVCADAYCYSKFAGIHPGAEPSADRRFAALLTAEAGHIFCFYIEAVGSADAEFNKVANDLFDSVEIA